MNCLELTNLKKQKSDLHLPRVGMGWRLASKRLNRIVLGDENALKVDHGGCKTL